MLDIKLAQAGTLTCINQSNGINFVKPYLERTSGSVKNVGANSVEDANNPIARLFITWNRTAAIPIYFMIVQTCSQYANAATMGN